MNNIDTSDFVIKTKYKTGKTEIENKIPVPAVLLKKLITILNSLNWKTIFEILVV